jgi:hypothetical protein
MLLTSGVAVNGAVSHACIPTTAVYIIGTILPSQHLHFFTEDEGGHVILTYKNKMNHPLN